VKENIPDIIERHVIYFLTGFVAVISVVLVLTFLLYLFVFAPIFVFGGYYLFIIPFLTASMYYIGRNIINRID
jgi:hypothetical protein